MSAGPTSQPPGTRNFVSTVLGQVVGRIVGRIAVMTMDETGASAWMRASMKSLWEAIKSVSGQ